MSIRDLLDELDIPYRIAGQNRHCTDGWVNIDCPFCSPDSRKFKLGLSERGRSANCWSCGRLDIVSVMALIKGNPIDRGLVERLRRGFGPDKMLTEKARHQYQPPSTIQSLHVPSGIGPTRWLTQVREYLESRRFDPDQIGRIWDVGVVAAGLFIPIFEDGVEVSYTVRQLRMQAGPRYISCPRDREAVSAKDLLYGEDFCRGACVVVEGPIDAWAIGPGAVATMGLAYSRSQLLRISKYPLRVICFDAEEQAQRVARELAAALSAFPGKTVRVTLETGKDPAEADRAEVEELRRLYLDG